MVKNIEYDVEFQIVDMHAKPILGLSSCEDMNLVQRIDVIDDSILSSYGDVFQGIGEMRHEYCIQYDKTVRPVVHPPRKVPAALRENLQKELERMETEGIIEKVDHPTDWVSSLVIVEKRTGGLRLCLDPRDLNKAVRREHWQLPTIEEIASRQSGNKIFSVLDATSAFWQIKLDPSCTDLTTFNTPFGRYKFLRLPFGLNSAAEVFAKRFHQAFERIPGVESYMDELLIGGKDVEEHDQRLRDVLETARKENIKLKPSKCSLRVSEVKFVGHIITDKGLKPDDSKIEAIRNMPSPTNRKELERFLGMINYLSKFLPNLSSVTAPLRELIKKENEWQWLHQHEEAVQHLKRLVTESPVLAFYDPQKPVLLSVDASLDGLGCYLAQEGRPIAYASRSLTDCEKRYAQIEREMLAVVYGAEHFHYYVYARPVTIESDHKPLQSILQKPLSAAPPRLQRMLLRLMKYDVNLIYKPGREMYIADTLSRASLPTKTPDWDAQIHLITNSLPISHEKLEIFRQETANDRTLQELKTLMHSGWPTNKDDVPQEVRAYTGFQDELSENDGLLFKGEQLIVPKTLQKDMLQKIHEGHLGRDKCLARAKDVLFWIGMSAQIVNLVSCCSVCNERQNAQQNEPMLPHDIPALPWTKLAADIYQLEGKQYLLIVDYYSKFFEISQLSSLRTSDVIQAFKEQFARFGICQTLVTDAGSCFTSYEFSQFAKDWEFAHVTTSPKLSRSNGMAERTIQTVKNIIKKAKAAQQDPMLAILHYRNTPIIDGKSPAQLLMNRRLRTKLPCTEASLRPSVLQQEKIQQTHLNRQRQQKKYFDRHASSKSLSELKKGDKVRMQMTRQSPWIPATVVTQTDQPRSYIVSTTDGRTIRRNRVMLKPCH